MLSLGIWEMEMAFWHKAWLLYNEVSSLNVLRGPLNAHNTQVGVLIHVPNTYL